MIERIAIALLQSEVAGVRRRIAGTGIMLAGMLLLVMAAGFGFIALYLWLAQTMAPWLAALTVAGWVLAFALALILAGRSMSHSAGRRSKELRAEMGAHLAGLMPGRGKEHHRTTLGLILAAAIAGIVLGRRV